MQVFPTQICQFKINNTFNLIIKGFISFKLIQHSKNVQYSYESAQ